MTSSTPRAQLTLRAVVQMPLLLQRRDLVPSTPKGHAAAMAALAQLLLEAAQPALEKEEDHDAS